MNRDLCKKCEWFSTINRKAKICFLSYKESLCSVLFNDKGEPSKAFEMSDHCPYVLEHIVSGKKHVR